jgi:hypothetical protein
MSLPNKFIRMFIRRIFLAAEMVILLLNNQGVARDTDDILDPPRIMGFPGNQPMTRVDRPFEVLTSVSNPAKTTVNLTATLKLPEGVRSNGNAAQQIKFSPDEKVTLRWILTARKTLYGELLLHVSVSHGIPAVGRLPVRFLPKIKLTIGSCIPEPLPIKKTVN